MLKRLLAIALGIILLGSLGTYADIIVKYDEDGRMIEMVTDAGDQFFYSYNEDGNVTGINVIALDPIEIDDPEELEGIRSNMAGSYKLMSDIDLKNKNWVPIGTMEEPFSGTLDGNGFTIKNLTVNLPAQYNVGLLGFNDGMIINLTLTDVAITGKGSTGSIAGTNTGNLINCRVGGSSSVSGDGDVGGLVGTNMSNIIMSRYEGEVHGNSRVGGLVGYIFGGTVDQCYAAANVSANASYVGGFAGYMEDGSSVIRNSFSVGKVEGLNNTAGFAGNVDSGNIEYSYSISNNANGFSNKAFAGCYFDSDWIAGSEGKPGARTTDEMKSESNYKGWDFNDVWTIEEGIGYPTLIKLPNPTTDRYIEDDKDSLTFEDFKADNEDADTILTDLAFPASTQNGARILWESSNTDVIAPDGTVTRPPYGSGDAEVTITARITYAFASGEKTFTLTVIEAEAVDAVLPVIGSQPINTEALQNETAALSVTASVESGELSYQWYENTDNEDVLIEGADEATFNPPTNTLGEKRYYCVITNTDDAATGEKTATVTSDTVTVTVHNNAETPTITLQPVNVTVLTDEPATLTVEASVQLGELSYQWYKEVNGSGVLISGATDTSYSPPTNTAGLYYYYCEVTNTDETATKDKVVTIKSDIVTVKVNSREDAEIPSISGPDNVSVLEGETAELTVSAEVENGILSYQWYEITESGDIPIDGATEPTYAAPTDLPGVRAYYCEVTNTNEDATGNPVTSANSGTATVTVIAIVDAEIPTITEESPDYNVPVNGSVVLLIEADVSSGTLSYQWFERTEEGDFPIDGANQKFYIAPTGTLGERVYLCEITNTDPSVTGIQTASVFSNPITVTVSELSVFHNIALDVEGMVQFADAEEDYDAPETKTIQIANAGTEGVTGLGTAISGGDTGAFTVTQPEESSLSGDQTTTFTIKPRSGLAPKIYIAIVTVSGDDNVLVSFIASFTVQDGQAENPIDAETPIITQQPEDAEALLNESVILSVAASVGRGELSYQWYERTNSGNIAITGATRSYFDAPTDALGTKRYYCVITNTDNSATGTKTISVNSDMVTVIVTEPTESGIISMNVGGTFRFVDADDGYRSVQVKEVRIENEGTERITGLYTELSGRDANAFYVTQPEEWELSGGETTEFTVEPEFGLSEGTYTAVVNVYDENDLLASFTVRFTVLSPWSSPSPPSPSPPPSEPEDEPDTQTVEISVNDTSVDAEVTEDGTLIISLTESYTGVNGEIKVDVSAGYDNIQTHISISALNGNDLVITTAFGELRIPKETLASLRAEHGDILNLSLKKGSFTVNLLDRNDKEIPYNDPTKPMTLTLPYALKTNENPRLVVAVDANGKVVPNSVYKDGAVTAEITKAGVYNAAYRDVGLTDIAGHWAADSINFVMARGLFTTYGGNRFAPSETVTRAMFVQVLANLDGADLSAYTTSRFSDVPSDMAAIEWAASVGIVTGDGTGKFNPHEPVNRQQMSLLLISYMKYKGIQPPNIYLPATFADEDTISPWALDAVKSIQATGIISGKPGNLFDPFTIASKAEAAVIITKFIDAL